MAVALLLVTTGLGACTDFSSGVDQGPPCVRLDLSCTDCHGDRATDDPAPPRDTHGESDPSLISVGAHQAHLGPSSWHAELSCDQCHAVPAAVSDEGHIDGEAALTWGDLAAANGAVPMFDRASASCEGVYCHGSTLLPGGDNLSPTWTAVDSNQAACGSCHGLPPASPHTQSADCGTCHGAVIASFDVAEPASSVWANPGLHIDGVVEASGYHDLSGWIAPKGGGDHHGSNYFLTNQQRDEHDVDCTACHGANLDGGSSGVSCDNLGCHGRDWRSCDFCHGTFPGQYNPPEGVGGETTMDTLAVGRHVEHLGAGSTHVAFSCETCHVLPAAGDVSHALGYVPSADLQTAGHHGDVLLAGRAAGMTFDVTATAGNPVTARGSCVGACHSNARGGTPNVIPYWAGGAWPGGCNACHDAQPSTGEHNKHRNEGIPCSECHPGQSSGSHVNGTVDFGGGVSFDPNGCGSGQPSCSGSCHGENHSTECW